MKIAIITAGGAGMFCGSCMQDNTLARALRLAGEDAVLVPTYTPIRVDEENVSTDRVFMWGINVYLDSVLPGWKRLPGWMTHWLNRPALIRWLTKFGNNTDASKLGALTLDMLKGTLGPQQREVREFADYLCNELRPDVIVFSNALLSGVLSELRPRFTGTILCLLQGDDIFLEDLTERWKNRVLKQLCENCNGFDGFLTHSRYYCDLMQRMLSISDGRFRQIPLTIDAVQVRQTIGDLQAATEQSSAERFRIGYFARICPQKGVQNLLSSASEVFSRVENAEISIAGFLPDQHRQWFERLLNNTTREFPNRIHWQGSPVTREEKFRIICNFDVLCVPTDYQEPKGLYVLEAALANVQSVVPRHGAFPELIDTIGAGRTYDAGSVDALARQLVNAAQAGRTPSANTALPDQVEQQFGMAVTGKRIADVIRSFG